MLARPLELARLLQPARVTPLATAGVSGRLKRGEGGGAAADLPVLQPQLLSHTLRRLGLREHGWWGRAPLLHPEKARGAFRAGGRWLQHGEAFLSHRPRGGGQHPRVLLCWTERPGAPHVAGEVIERQRGPVATVVVLRVEVEHLPPHTCRCAGHYALDEAGPDDDELVGVVGEVLVLHGGQDGPRAGGGGGEGYKDMRTCLRT
jgi:hypothetical protein